ncbi:MAG: hypothetical protein IJ685_10960, partial [Selenomonadaceae bacterium]|nr:hypothetical protein [Selenomonadaceae bacterium]
TKPAHFDGNIYKSASNTAGYKISDDAKKISYTAAVPETNLFTLSGIKTTDGITVDGNVVTLTAANLNNQDVTITGDGYTLALDKNYSSTTKPAHFDGNIYKSASNTDGYKISDDAKSIRYTAEIPATNLFTLSGIKSTDGITVENNIVTVTASSLDKKTVTISDGYKIAIADDVEQPSHKSKLWTKLDEDTYLYTSGGTTIGYTLRGNKIIYSDEISGGEQYTISGAADTKLISEVTDVEPVEENSLSRRKVVLIETEDHNPENELNFYGENYARVTVAAGQNSLITSDGARSKVDMMNADNVTVVAFNGKVTLDNYDIDSGSVILVQDVDNLTDAIKSDDVKLIGNEVQINSTSRVAVNNPNNDSTLVKLTNYDGETQTVGFTGINGGTLDASDRRENLLLKGNYAEKFSTLQKLHGSTLIGGSGNNTILAGSRDFADAGDGKNEIYLTPHQIRGQTDSATISASGNSQNTVHNFQDDFGNDSDVAQVENLSNVKFKFESDGLSIRDENSQLLLDGVGTNSSSADSEFDFATDEPEYLLLTDGQSTLNAAVAKTNQTVLVTKNNGITPDAFFGDNSGLNFSAYNGDIEVNLSDGTGEIDGHDAIFDGINKISAGNGFSTLMGSAGNETLSGGDGNSSLWSNAGNDVMIGSTGITKFFFDTNDGRDTIKSFNFDTDSVNIFGNVVTDVKSDSAGNVTIQINGDDDYLMIENATDKNFRFNGLVANVNENVRYNAPANQFVGTGDNATLTVDDSAEIWMDNRHGKFYDGNIKTIDATNSTGEMILAGNDLDNTIIAGNGDASLWGGNTGNDLLIGGDGQNIFFYEFGNGNDTIQNLNDGDIVELAGLTLDEISSTKITSTGVTINFVDGGQLNVEGTSQIDFRINGETYAANHENSHRTNKG